MDFLDLVHSKDVKFSELSDANVVTDGLVKILEGYGFKVSELMTHIIIERKDGTERTISLESLHELRAFCYAIWSERGDLEA